MESQQRSLDVVCQNLGQLRKRCTGEDIITFVDCWYSTTVHEVRSPWISKLRPIDVFHYYTLVKVAKIGPTLDTHPLEDVYKAVKIISQYTEMTHSYSKLLDASGYGEKIRQEFSDTLLSAFDKDQLAYLTGFLAGLNTYGLLEKYCKWSTASLWAWGLAQKELPPPPEFMSHHLASPFRYLFSSRRWKRAFKISNKPSRLEQIFLAAFFKDLYNCKGAAAAVGPEFIEQALVKHKEILTTPKTPPTPVGVEDRGKDLILEAITQAAETIFGSVPRKNKRDKRPPSRFPSLNSSYNYSRMKGGAGGEILSQIDEANDEFYALQPAEGYFWGYAHHNAECIEVRTPYDPAIWQEAEILSESRAVAKAAAGLGVDAQVIPLSEPFKVRTITKGDCDMYHLARRWQKVIHSKMRKQKNCALIGRPCDGVFLSQIFYESSHFDHKNEKKGFFVSGDYESATDLLNPELSLWAQNEISSRLSIPLEHQRVLNACLTEHNLYYGEKDVNGNKITHKQTWGQLMGSPVSFPVLCLINLAATKLAYEIYYREELARKTGIDINLIKKVDLPIHTLPMCVNGDDILFWCHSDRHYQIWKEVTANAGLKFSLGKNYTHRSYCIINSEMYRYHHNESLPFVKVPCLNTRLIEGGNRSTVTSVHPLHEFDFEWLVKDNHFNPKKHLKRFCSKVNPNHTPLKNLQLALKERKAGPILYNEYASWFLTIEARRSVLQRQATEMLSDKPARRPAQIYRGQLMEKILDQRFTKVQFRRLNEFRASLGSSLGKSFPYNLPQSLGGFGFPRGPEHKYTVTDYRTAALAYSEPKEFRKALKMVTPKLARAGFMSAVSKELSFLSKALAIPEVTQIVQYESYKPVDNGSIFELDCLSGFVSPTNLVVGEHELSEAFKSRVYHTREITRATKYLNRKYNLQMRGAEKRRAEKQLATDLEEGIERIETILLDAFAESYHIQVVRPSPRF
ncbi:RNA-dependent RNA polymerase [Shahe narna-like virus 1]|uniref:RNA-dependent RNA polymerase n=1 Tax=Shahe narna-like virus 1 TaxID=1923429 RepID=UPI00090C1420|nr:RNA-dependent RNA polymerase [Shahe narna-like virus 1]APG77165.1 RNA-dependent RNA polymerase [Shahe narna-like virus 1]